MRVGKTTRMVFGLWAILMICLSPSYTGAADPIPVAVIKMDFPDTIVKDTGYFAITDQGLIEQQGRIKPQEGHLFVRFLIRLNLPKQKGAVSMDDFELRHSSQPTLKPTDFFTLLGEDIDEDRYSIMGGVGRATNNSELGVVFSVSAKDFGEYVLYVSDFVGGNISKLSTSDR